MASLIAPDGLPHQVKEGSESGRLWWSTGRWWLGAKGSVGKGRGVLRSSDCYGCATTAPGWQALNGPKRSVCMQRRRPDLERRAPALRCMRVLLTALAPPLVPRRWVDAPPVKCLSNEALEAAVLATAPILHVIGYTPEALGHDMFGRYERQVGDDH